MNGLIVRQNIKHYRELLLKDDISDTARQRILSLLKEEQAKLMMAESVGTSLTNPVRIATREGE